MTVVEQFPLIIQEQGVLVDAKLLHEGLLSTTSFKEWISYRIREYEFKEGQDYFTEKFRLSAFGRPQYRYNLTLDMAKELAMLEKNESGRQMRRFFIAKEKELRGDSQSKPEAALFRGLKAKRVNDRDMYPYREMLERIGYKTTASGQRRARYWMHFIKDSNLLYITKEFALHLYRQRQIKQNVATLLNSQPVLPFNFGDPQLLIKEGK